MPLLHLVFRFSWLSYIQLKDFKMSRLVLNLFSSTLFPDKFQIATTIMELIIVVKQIAIFFRTESLKPFQAFQMLKLQQHQNLNVQIRSESWAGLRVRTLSRFISFKRLSLYQFTLLFSVILFPFNTLTHGGRQCYNNKITYTFKVKIKPLFVLLSVRFLQIISRSHVQLVCGIPNSLTLNNVVGVTCRYLYFHSIYIFVQGL